MKILFINKYDITGGAGIAAFRLHSGLEKYHSTENKFLVGIKRSNHTFVIETRKAGLQNFIERGINYLQNRFGYQYYYFPFSSKTIIEYAQKFKPDIISLHNAHGGYLNLSLLPVLSHISPIVWTLHDMWAFTANAAHTHGDNSWERMKSGKNEKNYFPQIGIDRGTELLSRKQKIYGRTNITIVTPSKWLYNLANKSPLFASKKIMYIPNGIDTKIFKPVNNKAMKKKINIPPDSKAIIFVAENIIKSEYKGGNDLLEIMKYLDENITEKIYLILIGKIKKEEIDSYKNLVIIPTGYIYEETTMAEYLSAADLLVYPTKADNLPSILMEAAACGTPSITFNIGGCSEIILEDYNGYLIPPFDLKKFSSKVLEVLNDTLLLSRFSSNARKLVEEKFPINKIASEYYSLFGSLVSWN